MIGNRIIDKIIIDKLYECRNTYDLLVTINHITYDISSCKFNITTTLSKNIIYIPQNNFIHVLESSITRIYFEDMIKIIIR